MATYVNDLRLTELATGEGSGTWGTTTNTNLELIGEALGYGTQNCFATDADATTTVADGASDPARSMYFKVTSSATLTATRVLTIAPNTVSRVMFIENATTGSQSINISQGSGANVTIATGKTAVVYLDGAGSTAAVVDALALVDPGVTDTLAEVLTAGNTSGGTGLIMSSGDDLTLTGASYNVVWDSSDSALEFGDNAKAVFGAGSDLEIYHDGSNSYISEVGTGELVIQARDAVTIEDGTSGDNYVYMQRGNKVSLFYAGAEKLATTATGIDVTGTAVTDGLTVDGTATITTADNTTQLTLKSTDTDASVGPLLDLHRDSSSPADNDYIGEIRFRGENDASEIINYAGLASRIIDVTDGTEDGRFELYTSLNGSQISRVLSDASETVINQDSADLDFRVESDGNANMLFVDASANRVGVGISPTETLHVDGRSRIQNLYLGEISSNFDIVQATSSAGLYLVAGTSNVTLGTSGFIFNETSADVDFRVESDGATHMLFVDAGANRVGIGEASPDTPLHLTTSATQVAVTIESTSGSAVSGPDISLWRNSSDPADEDDLARIYFHGENDAGSKIEYGLIRASVNDVTAGTEDSSMQFYTYVGGAQSDRLAIEATETSINESSRDVDFRVESDNNANALFVDAGNDQVKIGDSASTWTSASLVVNGPMMDISSTTAYTTNATMVLRPSSTVDTYGWHGILLSNSAVDGFGYTIGDRRTQTDGNNAALDIRYHSNSVTGFSRQYFKSSEVVFNDESTNFDFRVESDGNSHALFVDAGAGTTAINTSTLTHAGSTGGSLVVSGGTTGATSPIMLVVDGDASVEGESTLLECSFAGDNTFSEARYVQFRDSGGVQGTISGTGDGTVDYNTSSDERLKQNIQDTASKWDLVKSLQVRDYEWKKSGKQDTGFIAQELYDKWAQPVKVGGEDVTNDPWSIDYGKLTPILTKALQEAMEKIEALEAKVAALESN